MLFKVDITYKALASFKSYLKYVSFGQKLSELRLATITSQKCWNRDNISIHVLKRSLTVTLLIASWNGTTALICMTQVGMCVNLACHALLLLRGEGGRSWREVRDEPNECLHRKLRYVPSEWKSVMHFYLYHLLLGPQHQQKLSKSKIFTARSFPNSIQLFHPLTKLKRNRRLRYVSSDQLTDQCETKEYSENQWWIFTYIICSQMAWF